MLRFVFSLFMITLCFPSHVNAVQEVTKSGEVVDHITGLDIEDHFAYIEKIYTGDKPDMYIISKFVQGYPTDSFILKNTIKTNRGTQEPHTVTLNKDQFIESEKKRDYELYNSRIRHTLTNIKYLDDNVSAEVSYTSLYQGKMKKFIKGEGVVFLDFKSLSVCTNIMLFVDSKIKGKKANCTTEIIYGDPVTAK